MSYSLEDDISSDASSSEIIMSNSTSYSTSLWRHVVLWGMLRSAYKEAWQPAVF